MTNNLMSYFNMTSNLISYFNMDGSHKTTDKLKKGSTKAFGSTKALLSVINNFSLEAFLCSNIYIQVFSVSEPPHITITREG